MMETVSGDLNEIELEHILKVHAYDLQLRHERLNNIKSNQATLESKKSQRDSFTMAHNFTNDNNCVLCCQLFSWPFKRAIQCTLCHYKVCKSCVVNSSDNSCTLCQEEREIRLQKKEWELSCPFPVNSFGYNKFVSSDRRILSTILNGFDWYNRAKIEQKVCCFLKKSLDSFLIDNEIQNDLIGDWKHNFEAYLVSGQISSNEIFSHLEILKRLLQNMHAKNELPKVVPGKAPKYYEASISSAIALQVLSEAEKWPIEKQVSTGTQTDIPTLDAVSLSSAAEHVQKHKIPLPRFDSNETEHDSALDTDLESISSWGRRNWFFKNHEKLTPEGSMRSQSQQVPVSLQSFVKSFSNNSYPQQQSLTSQDSTDSESSNGVIVSNGQPPYFTISPNNVACNVGDLTQFHAKVNGTEPIDVYWYNSNQELADQGRFRIIDPPNSSDHWLEIFDVESTDNGEIVCLAVNEISVCTAIATLRVQECDIAGEEPQFTTELDSIVAKHNQVIKLSCKVMGNPLPRVTFHHNNLPIKTGEHQKIDRKDDGIWTLEIINAVVRDSGQYTAVATNRIGRAISKAAVSVLADPKQPRAVPRRSKIPKRKLSHEPSFDQD